MGLGAGSYSPYAMSLRDHGGEVGTFGVHGLLISSANFTAYQALRDAFDAGIVGATLGVCIYSDYGGLYTIVNPISKAASVSAQRENKLLVRYYDVTTYELLTATIPTIDLPGLVFLSEANDFIQISGTGTPTFITALIAAWENFVVNPRTNNLTVVASMEYVGRNR